MDVGRRNGLAVTRLSEDKRRISLVVGRQFDGFRRPKNFFGPGSFTIRPVKNEQKLVRLESAFVVDDIALRNAHVVKSGSESSQTTVSRRSLQSADDRRNQRAANQDRPDPGHPEECLPGE